MGARLRNHGLVKITTFESLQIHVFSLIWGFWYMFKRLLKQVWKSPTLPTGLGKPPKCLTDTSFGDHSYIKLKGVKLHYVDSGDKNQPLAILLHGFPDCWISWRAQISELSKYYRVITIDLKGFGDSDKPESCHNYQIDKLVGELSDLITTLGYRRCTIVGHDLGAIIGWFLVHLNPDLVDKFVAVSAPHPNLYWNTVPNNSLFNSSWVQFCQLPIIPEIKVLEEDLVLLTKVYSHLKKGNEEDSFLTAYKYAFSRKEDWIGAINYFRTLPFWRINYKSPCQVSTLLVVGNQDNSVLLESVIKSTEYLEKFSVKVMDHVGHYPHQENQHKFNEILINFLVGPPSPSSPDSQSPNGIVNRMFGAVSSTVKYGNSVLEKTNKLRAKALYFGNNS